MRFRENRIIPYQFEYRVREIEGEKRAKMRQRTLEEKEELGLVGLNGILLDDVQGGPRSIRNPLRNVVYSGNYDTSSYHPAGEGRSVGVDENKPSLLGPEHDFIIARNSAGIATPMWHAFANATIGTAHIQNAAIT